MVVAFIGVVISIVLLMYLSMKGWSIFITGPICALIVAMSSGLSPLGSYTVTFMKSSGDYFVTWFPIFMLGALFGKIMQDTGASSSLAEVVTRRIGKKYACVAIIIATTLLTYGGVSLFVVVFAVYPFAIVLFQQADLPKKLIPGCIAAGAFTYTSIAIPGSPQLMNIIPIKYFGTNAMAAPVLGSICAVFMIACSIFYMNWRAKCARKNQEHFIASESDRKYLDKLEDDNLPNPVVSILPLVLVVVLLDVFKLDIVICMTIACLCGSLLFLFDFEKVKQTAIVAAGNPGGAFVSLVQLRKKNVLSTFNTGVFNSMKAILNTAFAVGFGSVIEKSPTWKLIVEALSRVSFGNALVYVAIMAGILGLITGSSSGGLSIALNTSAKRMLASGINPQILHRVAAISSKSLCSVPYCGAVLTLLAICGTSHKEAYWDIFVVDFLVCVLATILAIGLGSLGVC